MSDYQQTSNSCISEDDFNNLNQQASVNIFSLSNGHIYQQANFEEFYSGETWHGCHISGITIQESPETGQWKNTISKSPDMLSNAPDWTGIIVRLNDEKLDFASWEILEFRYVLNMHEGYLVRNFEAISTKGHRIQVTVKRFVSMAKKEIGVISYSIKSINFIGRISFMPILDGDLKEQLINPNEPIWNVLQTKTQQDVAHLWTQIRRTDYHLCAATSYVLYKNNEQLNVIATKIEKEKIAGFSVGADVKAGDTLCLNKFTAIISSLDYSRKDLTDFACNKVRAAKQQGWNTLFEEHSAAMEQRWTESGIDINDSSVDQEVIYDTFRSITSR